MKSGFVSIIGRPNVGKSTLINNIVGSKIAIVSDKPQTTRNRIQGIYTCDAGQIIFVDTPGVHKPKHLLGEYMVDVTARSINEVDLVYYMVDATRSLGGGERYIINFLKEASVPVFLVLNKIDLVDDEGIDKAMQDYSGIMKFAEMIPISAARGTNIDHLLAITLENLPQGPLYYGEDDLTDQPVSFIAAELIREKALVLTRDEVPHALAVEIESFERKPAGKIYLRAVLYTERETQKAIIIGKGGSMLKKIGEQSRLDIERMLEAPVYLDLWVKVKKNWRDNEGNLKQLGYRP